MVEKVTVANKGKEMILVGPKYLFPGERRDNVLLQHYLAAKKRHPALALLDDQESVAAIPVEPVESAEVKANEPAELPETPADQESVAAIPVEPTGKKKSKEKK